MVRHHVPKQVPANVCSLALGFSNLPAAAHIEQSPTVHVRDQYRAGRLALRDAAHLFQHWQVRSNAERMNYWLSILAENRQLLTAGLRTNSSHGNSGGKLE